MLDLDYCIGDFHKVQEKLKRSPLNHNQHEYYVIGLPWERTKMVPYKKYRLQPTYKMITGQANR